APWGSSATWDAEAPRARPLPEALNVAQVLRHVVHDRADDPARNRLAAVQRRGALVLRLVLAVGVTQVVLPQGIQRSQHHEARAEQERPDLVADQEAMPALH